MPLVAWSQKKNDHKFNSRLLSSDEAISYLIRFRAHLRRYQRSRYGNPTNLTFHLFSTRVLQTLNLSPIKWFHRYGPLRN